MASDTALFVQVSTFAEVELTVTRSSPSPKFHEIWRVAALMPRSHDIDPPLAEHEGGRGSGDVVPVAGSVTVPVVIGSTESENVAVAWVQLVPVHEVGSIESKAFDASPGAAVIVILVPFCAMIAAAAVPGTDATTASDAPTTASRVRESEMIWKAGMSGWYGLP